MAAFEVKMFPPLDHREQNQMPSRHAPSVAINTSHQGKAGEGQGGMPYIGITIMEWTAPGKWAY